MTLTPTTPTVPPKKASKLTLTRQIFIGLAVGIVAGGLVERYAPGRAELFRPFSSLFLRLIKMLLAPLLFSTLVAGIAGAGHIKAVGRMFVSAMVYFWVATSLALVIGLCAVNLTRPGDGLTLPKVTGQHEFAEKVKPFVEQIVPASIVQAMAEGAVLQIVVFSLLFAIALGMIGERGRPVVQLCEAVSETMFRLTDIVMRYAPIGVGAAMAYTIGHGGMKVLWNLAKLVGTLYGALFVFLTCVLLPIALLAKVPLRRFFEAVKEPALIAFSTTTSEAALPRAMENMVALGVPKRIVSFVLPLGYSFNLDGSTLYLSLASVFVAQAAGVELTLGQQITMLLTLMITSKGVAAVPRASLVILSATLASFGLPLQGVAVILGVDALMDMARTSINLVGNCLATVVMARWEGAFELSPEDAEAVDHPDLASGPS